MQDVADLPELVFIRMHNSHTFASHTSGQHISTGHGSTAYSYCTPTYTYACMN